MKKSNNLEFISKANKIHNNKYDYCKINYINSKTNIIIICPVHGEFIQKPHKHLLGKGCIKCFYDSKTSNTNDFIQKSSIIHNNEYNYSLVDYINSYTKVKIICPAHGVFEQKPNAHLRGQKCMKCVNYNQTSSLESFISKANKIHDYRYNYIKVNYINSETNIIIICKKHGEFTQQPSNHLFGFGCPECSYDVLRNKDYIEKCKIKFDNKYDYSLVRYINNKQKVDIICPKHGVFNQSLKEHFKHNGCPYCSGKKMNNKLFIEKSNIKHNNKYDYSLTNYTSAFNKVKIICPKHGEFDQISSSHLHGAGCPICKSSRGEKSIITILNELNIRFEFQKIFKGCVNITNLPFDFYLPDFNMCIEYNGLQHYESCGFFGGDIGFEKRIIIDIIKKKYCSDNNIRFEIISYENNNVKKIKQALLKILS